jgi:hypothetical protein
MYQPDIEAMTRHVEHLFSGSPAGMVELAWTDTTPDDSGRYRLRHAKLFSTDNLSELVTEAARLNATPMCNVYIGAALRHPNTAPFGRAKDDDASILTAAYVDLDDPGAATAAKDIYGALKPTLIVVTGREPHTRAQLWWRLDAPYTDRSQWPELLKGMSIAMGADTSVTNPSRVMRLAGTVAWPVKPSRVIEQTGIVSLREPGQSAYSTAVLSAAFPKQADPEPSAAPPSVPKLAATLNAAKPTADRSTFFRQVNDLALRNSSAWVPTVFGSAAKFQAGTGAWRISSKELGRPLEEDLSIAPTGIVDFGVHDLGDARQGKRTPVDIVMEHGGALDAKAAAFWLCEQVGAKPETIGWQEGQSIVAPQSVADAVLHDDAPADDIYETLSLSDIDALPPPTWLVEGLIPETGLTFIYGKPGKGKSFITLDLALRIAHGFDWHGKECRQGGVLYVAGEGKGGYRNRVHGWHLHHGLVADCAPFRLLPRAINFMTPDDVAKLVRTIKAVVGDAKLVIVDTVARVLPGAEENASKEMGLFVAACDAIREACGVAVIGVHHSGKDEDRGMRGSTALEGAGDCVLHLKRGDDSKLVEVVTEKQKDGEEAKPLFLNLDKIEWMDGLKQASTLVPTVATAAPNQTHWPDRDTCRQIVRAINEAWISGKPWSFEPQSKRSGRYAPKLMNTSFRIATSLAESMIETWLMNDVLSVEMHNLNTKMKGLKVIGSI